MQYSDIKTFVYTATGTNSGSLPDAKMVVLANNAMERIASLIMRADSRWQFDDLNQPDRPEATTDIVANQKDYSLLTSHLTIDRAEVMDSSGNWWKLTPIDIHDVKFEAMEQHLAAPGLPLEYDKEGNSVILYPTPNYSQAASLKLYFTRPPVAFVAADTIATPGFNSLFHKLVPLWIAYDYSVFKLPNLAAGLMAEITRLEAALEEFYGTRGRDERPRFTMSTNLSVGNQSGRLGFRNSDSNR